MSKPIPMVPAETLAISTEELRTALAERVGQAERTGEWLHPYAEAATSFEEMTLEDIFYWVYKCQNPIQRAEKGVDLAKEINLDPSVVGLPEGFEVSNRLTMGAGGDLLRSPGTENSKDILFEKVADLLFDQDLSYANFESPVTTQPLVEEVIGDGGAPIECCSPEQFDIFKGHKGKTFTVMNTTNNHAFDMGLEGVETTWKMMEANGILDSGTNRTPEEWGTCKTIEVNGIRLGFVATTFGLNGHQVPEAEAYRINVSTLMSKVNPPDLSLLKRQIDDAKAKGCDFIIASVHWGFEFEFFPRMSQVHIAHELVEYGADMVIGNHPHALQPVEYYRTKRDPDRLAVITYSLGTLTWGFAAPHIVLCALLNCALVKGTHKGEVKTYTETAKVTPVFRSVTERNGRVESRIERLADHVDGKGDDNPREYVDKIAEYATLVLGDWR